MESIANPEIQAIMRAPPAIPVERIDSSVATSTDYSTYCQVYYTPQPLPPAVEHPGTPPKPPNAPRPLPPRKKGDTSKGRQALRKHYNNRVAKYNIALETYTAIKLAWEANYKAYFDSLELTELASNEDPDQDEEEENVFEDPIIATQPLVVFTYGRSTTLDDARITDFCQGLGREATF